MQKTITVNGKRYTGKQIARLMDDGMRTNAGDYIVFLSGGAKFYGRYRHIMDCLPFAPVCGAKDANAIKLESANDTCKTVWLEL